MKNNLILSRISLLFYVLSSIIFINKTDACTNYLVTKGASVDGSTMISYAADSHVRYGELYFRQGGKWEAGTMINIRDRGTNKYLGMIPQAAETYTVIGFMNQFQVSIGESTYGGRPELTDTTGMMDYGSLMFIALDRSKTAREAIKIIAELVEKYGYYSSGESFSIADKDEVWIMEIIGKGTEFEIDKKSGEKINKNKGASWVALRIPDGYVSAHANHARITTFPLENNSTSISSKNLSQINNPNVECVYSFDVIDFAKKKGYYSGSNEDFSFSDIYAPMDFSAARFCEIRVWSMFKEITSGMDKYIDYVEGLNLKNRMPLYVKPDRKLSVADLIRFKRDHLEGTKFDMTKDFGAMPYGLPYRWRPLTWKYNGKTYFNERATATQQTGFSFIAQMRSFYPDPIGGILWFSVDDAASTVYVPIYCGSTGVPKSYAEGNGDMLTYSADAAFWVFNKVANYAYSHYDLMIKDIQKEQSKLETKHFSLSKEMDQEATDLYKTDPTRAIENITKFSQANADFTVRSWEKLFQFLLVKYIDGNIKQEDGKRGFKRNANGFPASPTNVDYPDEWKQVIIEKTGDKFLMPEKK
ncbi:MAG: C69 family dipeptidase [Bacteroidota bacterium]